MAGDDFDEEYLPTIGINLISATTASNKLTFVDCSGSDKYREGWEKFWRSSDAILFIVDSTNLAKMEESRKALFELLDWPSLESVPVGIIGSKSDKEGWFSEEELIVQMELYNVTNREVACFTTSSKETHEFIKKWISNLKRRNIVRDILSVDNR